MSNRDSKNYKINLCWHYMNKGYCSLFDKCHFAHGHSQLRSKADPIPNVILPQFKPISIYKTQFCKYFMNGYCRNQGTCPFAHGSTDLHAMMITSTSPIPPTAPLSPPVTMPQIAPIAPIMQPNSPQNTDYGQAGQFLSSILRNLEQVFPDEVNKKVLIKKGLELVETGQLPEANQIINQLVNSNTLTERQKEQCQTILSNAYSLHKITKMQFS